MDTQESQLLREALEEDAGKPLSTGEVRAVLALAGGTGIWGILVATTVWLYIEHGSTWPVAALAGFVAMSGLVLIGAAAKAIEGRRAWREMRMFAPPPEAKPEPLAIPPPTPIIVRRPNGTSYVLPEADEPLSLPDGRRALGLNEDTLRAVLAEVIEKHDGRWSRKRLMAIRVGGERVTRKLYEQLTDGLTRSGFLQERPTGGFELPHDIKSIADLALYIPQMVGKAGRVAGRQERARAGSEQDPGGEVGTLAGRQAEVHRARL